MTLYPPPPWTLLGHALAVPVVLRRRRLTISEPLIPLGAAGRVPGVLIAARYRPGSALPYSELALLAGVRHGIHVGSHVLRIWVDSEASVAGGRAVWALPKELADFEWMGDPNRPAVHVRIGHRTLVRLELRGVGPAVRLPGSVPLCVLGVREGRPEEFRVGLRARVRWAAAQAALPRAADAVGGTESAPLAEELIGAKVVGGLMLDGLAAEVEAPRSLGPRPEHA